MSICNIMFLIQIPEQTDREIHDSIHSMHFKRYCTLISAQDHLKLKVELARHLSSVQNPPLIEDFNEGPAIQNMLG